MRWFGRKTATFLSADEEDWQLKTFLWLRRHVDGALQPSHHRLVLPNREFFPPTAAEGHDKAEFVLGCVKQHMGMRDWPCRLLPQPERPSGVLPGMTYSALHASGPAGTFGLAGNTAEITYDPAYLGQPWRLVAVMAHELAHFRLAVVGESPPGAPDLGEPATDLTTIAFGFGLFGANVAFEFRRDHDYQGSSWRTSRLGYLSEREWIFGLAIFLEVGSHASLPLKPYMNPHLWSDLQSARRSLGERRFLLDPLRNEQSPRYSPVMPGEGPE